MQVGIYLVNGLVHFPSCTKLVPIAVKYYSRYGISIRTEVQTSVWWQEAIRDGQCE